MVFHVLNRGVNRRTLFFDAGDYEAFIVDVLETLRTRPMRICSYCIMPNHWHMVLWPERDGDTPQTIAEVDSVRHCSQRGCPLGHDRWAVDTAASLGLESTMRQSGRPRKHSDQTA
jgi:REP element-mobilizing transposase RayT